MNLLPELPAGVVPHGVDLTISRQEFERAIMSETDEIGAAFDREGRLVVRPRRGNVQEVEFFDHERPALIDRAVVHNHPLHGIVSTSDGVFAVEWNVAEMRIVLPSGLVHSIVRPDGGWPASDIMTEAMERSIHSLRSEAARRARRGLLPLGRDEAEALLLRERQNDLQSIGVWLRKGSVWGE